MAAIAFLDSGVGGVSVLKRVHALLPCEDLILYGDSKNAPFGKKSIDELRQIAKNALYFLSRHDIKALVLACNTLSSLLIDEIRTMTDLPVIGILPPVSEALSLAGQKKALILATKNTAQSSVMQNAARQHPDKVILLPGGNIVDFVEKGDTDSPALKDHIASLLSGICTDDIGALALGCTHYPFVKNLLRAFFREDCTFIDGSEKTAAALKSALQKGGLLSQSGQGSVRFFSSGENAGLMEKLFLL